ncbi:hypothetical protein B0H14DRAFT_2840151 [Mycena olivaceomarginata]|nr:hypothetical protein B0H14DRAFT_2840151 [Mycena olivaceomarginata]
MPSKRQREEYFVEVIMKARRTKHAALPGKDFLNSPAWEYLIKWAGYDDKDNTWEPVTELSACTRLIGSFWEDVGTDSYLTNKKGFEVPASEQWIKEKLYFASQTPLDEVREQNLNPKRRHSAPSSPATSPRKHNGKRKPSAPSSPSILSTPHARPTGSPRKVSFAPSANARIFTSSAENTAQFDRMTQQHTYEPSSDSEDDRPIAASLNFGIPALPVDTPPRTPERSEPTAEMPPETPASQPCTPPPSSSDPLFSPPPRRCIQIYDPPITPSSKLATKQRLAKVSMAPEIPRAESSGSKAMDIDAPGPTPTLVPNENMSTPADVDDPMLSSMLMGEDNIDSASTGFYEANEDPYASLRTNTDPFENSEYYDANPVSSSEAIDFLSTVELPPAQ